MPSEAEKSLGDSPLMVSLSNHPAEAETTTPCHPPILSILSIDVESLTRARCADNAPLPTMSP